MAGKDYQPRFNVRMARQTNDRHLEALREAYKRVKDCASVDYKSSTTSDALTDLVTFCLDFLGSQCQRVNLTSRVAGKMYDSYVRRATPDSPCRPINRAYYIGDSKKSAKLWQRWQNGTLKPADIAALTYTMAMAPCAAIDLFDRGNKKAPATYFECLVGHLFAKTLGVNPTKKAALPTAERTIRLTMDFIFDLGDKKPKLHLPVKLSTRERVVQAWAHQRMLDGAYGHKSYKGILVVFAETKLNLTTREVVEICVPDQWLAYQTHLAEMARIYYFDIPERYRTLSKDSPELHIAQFADFFAEGADIIKT